MSRWQSPALSARRRRARQGSRKAALELSRRSDAAYGRRSAERMRRRVAATVVESWRSVLLGAPWNLGLLGTAVARAARILKAAHRLRQKQLWQVQHHIWEQHREGNGGEKHDIDRQGSKHGPGKGHANKFRGHQQG